MPEKSPSPEIIKLMDKISQNPSSRLFVPLAEEYLKCDMADEAVWVLSEGIKNNPTYVAARVMLGKIYLQKKQTAEAKGEFEKVIEVNPENILAHKKLAVIYDEEGQYPKAIEACHKILKIDPSDKETKATLVSLEKKAASVSEALFQGVSPSPVESGAFQAPSWESFPEPESEPTAVLDQPPAAEDPNPDRQSDQTGGEVLPAAEDLHPFISEAPIPAGPEGDAVPDVESAGGEPVQEAEAPPFSAAPGLVEEPRGAAVAPIITEEHPDIAPPIPDSALSLPGPAPAENGFTDEDLATATLASLYMRQGHFEEAAKIYRKRLERDPSDAESRQGLEAALSRLSAGDPKEEGPRHPPSDRAEQAPQKAKTERLEAWLNAIRKDREQ